MSLKENREKQLKENRTSKISLWHYKLRRDDLFWNKLIAE
jgi:hypothetical protein